MAYIELLAQSFKSPGSVRNYISGITTMHKYINAPCEAIKSFEVQLMLRALDLTMIHLPNRRRPITPDILQQLLALCPHMGNLGLVMKVGILFAFLGFLRQSNLAPPSQLSFNPLAHTCRGDILLQPPGLVIMLKWSKSHQTGEQVALVPIPSTDHPANCPRLAFLQLVDMCPGGPDDPLLMLPGSPSPIVVDIPLLASTFNNMIRHIGLSPEHFSLHSLRRGGASVSYQAGVQATAVQRHGQWSSDSFWRYIVMPMRDAPVPAALREAITSSVPHQ